MAGMRNRVSRRTIALVTVVILDHASTVKYSDHVWHSPKDLSYYSLLNHFIVSQLYINGGELKHCTFGYDFTLHAQEFGRKYKQTL